MSAVNAYTRLTKDKGLEFLRAQARVLHAVATPPRLCTFTRMKEHVQDMCNAKDAVAAEQTEAILAEALNLIVRDICETAKACPRPTKKRKIKSSTAIRF